MYTAERGEIPEEKSLRKCLNKMHFLEDGPWKRTSGRSAHGRFSRLICKVVTCLRDGGPHLRVSLIWLQEPGTSKACLIQARNFAFGFGLSPSAGSMPSN